MVLLDEMLADPATDDARRQPGRFVAMGLVDAPDRQDQHPGIVDLEEEGGGWLVFGSGGSGKTTLLRTVAARSLSRNGPR